LLPTQRGDFGVPSEYVEDVPKKILDFGADWVYPEGITEPWVYAEACGTLLHKRDMFLVANIGFLS